jgi:hypothetical protein
MFSRGSPRRSLGWPAAAPFAGDWDGDGGGRVLG